MREVSQDLWTVKCDWICITTNGIVKRDGRATMGRGCALEAKNLMPDLDLWLGDAIQRRGNHVHRIGDWKWKHDTWTREIYSFPVKHHWRDFADLDLIAQSCAELIEWIHGALDNGKTIPTIALPRPGCDAGGRSWQYEVKPVLERYFGGSSYIGDHIIVVAKPGEE